MENIKDYLYDKVIYCNNLLTSEELKHIKDSGIFVIDEGIGEKNPELHYWTVVIDLDTEYDFITFEDEDNENACLENIYNKLKRYINFYAKNNISQEKITMHFTDDDFDIYSKYLDKRLWYERNREEGTITIYANMSDFIQEKYFIK